MPEGGEAVVLRRPSRNALSCSLVQVFISLRAVALRARRVGGVERVARELTPADRVLAGLVQAGVDVVDGLGREALLAVLLAGLGELRVEGVDLAAGELRQLHRADMRRDVALDVLHVGVVGRGPDRRLDRRQPLLGEVLASPSPWSAPM